MIRRPPRSTLSSSSAASDVYKRQAHLSAMNEHGPHPWQLSFSYGRALQAQPLKAWSGESSNINDGKKAFIKRSRLNSLARTGNYKPKMEEAG